MGIINNAVLFLNVLKKNRLLSANYNAITVFKKNQRLIVSKQQKLQYIFPKRSDGKKTPQAGKACGVIVLFFGQIIFEDICHDCVTRLIGMQAIAEKLGIRVFASLGCE